MQNFLTRGFQKLLTTLWALFLIGNICLSQDSTGGSTTVKTTTTTTHSEWYTAPWVWIVGVIIAILLLAAIFSGRRSSTSRTTISDAGTSRTITTDTDEV